MLLPADGLNNSEIARELGAGAGHGPALAAALAARPGVAVADLSVAARLADAPRSGTPARITPEQVCRIVALACEAPERVRAPDQPVEHHRVGRRDHAARHRRHDLAAPCRPPAEKGDLRPHLIRYWLTPPAADRAVRRQGHRRLHPVSRRPGAGGARRAEREHRRADRRPGARTQAPGAAARPGKVERREFEYIRHGTRSFILSRDIATGQVIAPHAGPTRTEADFLAHLQAVVATDPTATRWHVVADNLDTHRSASLVRWVAEVSGLDDLDLGVKSKSGILASRQTRAAFLADPTHRVVFHYTPNHSSWLNQIEIWLSILTRKLLRRGSFTSSTTSPPASSPSSPTTTAPPGPSNGPTRARRSPPDLSTHFGHAVLVGHVRYR